MHLDTRRMMINSMEIIENGLRLFIDRSSSSGEEIEASMTIKHCGGWCGDASSVSLHFNEG